MLPGLMMDRPLLISNLIDYAADYHGEREIVSRTGEGEIHRTTYAEIHRRARQLANALGRLGIAPGDRVGTIAWNNHRHVEIYFATNGMGAVCHTINPRLFPEQIDYIVNHAEDQILFVDTDFIPIVEKLADRLGTVRAVVINTDPATMPETSLDNVYCYEDLVGAESADFAWPRFDENSAASLCYTSGTTGNPKGVVYSHRSTVIHTYCVCMADVIGLGSRDSLLVIVPMFHANAWGTPYAAAMVGAKMVFPGSDMTGPSLVSLMRDEGVTLSMAVPTVWFGILDYLKKTKQDLGVLERIVVGGSAAPPSMIKTLQDDYGVRVNHAWGMTELNPVGTTGNLKASSLQLSKDEQFALQLKQGRPVCGIEMKIVDDDGNRLPHDGVAFGNVMVRGPWVAKAYFKGEGGQILDQEGWFPTGDVATIDADGYMQITDRSKDVIKSGGEWISSIELENLAVGHPKVAEAAVIGVHHPRWEERPLLLVVPAEGETPTRDELLAYYQDKVAKWWIPDDVVVVDELPHTPTGKLLKTKLRQDFGDHVLATVKD